MSEPIDIVVKDSISPAIRDKLLNIAQAALEGANSIQKLQNALKQTDAGALNKLISAQSRLENQVAKSNVTYLAQETALNKAVQAEARAETASAKLAAQVAKTNVVIDKSQLSAEKLAQAQAKTAEANEKAAAAATRGATAQTQLQNAITKGFTAETQAVTATQQLAAATANATAAQTRAASAATANAAAQARLSAAQATAALAQARAGAGSNLSAIAAQRLAQATTNAATAQTRAGAAVTQAATAQQRLASATAQAEAAQSRAAAAALRLQQAQDKAASGNNYFTEGLTRFAVRAAAAAAAYFTLQQFIEKTDAYTNLQNKLLQVSTSQAEVNRLTFELLDVANRSRAPLEAVGTTFQRINSALKTVGGSETEAIKITEALTKSTAAAGLSASEQASALLQVSQAFNKGKLDGDEFRSVMENFPQFADAITKSLGLANRGLLFSAAKEGKINLEVMRKAMLDLGDTADNQLNRSTITVDQSFTRLTNSTTVLLGELNKALGVTALLSKALNYMADAAANAAKANAGEGTAGAAAILQNNLDKINAQVDAQKASVEAGQAGLAGQTKLNNLLQIQSNIQAKISENANASRVSVRRLDNQADAAQQAGAQARLATAVETVYTQMDAVKVGTRKADQEIAKFRDGLDQLRKSSEELPTAQNVKLYQDALAKQAQVEAAIRKKDTASDPAAKLAAKEDYNRAISLGKVNAELDKQLNTFGQLAEARDANQKLEQIDINLASKNLASLTDAEQQEIKGKLDIIEINKRVQQSQDSIYRNAVGAEQQYKDATEALQIIEYKGLLTKEKIVEAQKAIDYAYQNSTDPLFQYNLSIKDQNALLDANLDIKERNARAAVQQINAQLAPKGQELDPAQVELVEKQNIALQKRNELQSAYDQIIANTKGAQEQLMTQLNALTLAHNQGRISQDQYSQGFVQIGLAMNQLVLEQGTGFATFENVALGAIGRIVEGYKNALTGLSESFGTFFTGLTDGFANSVGRAIVYGDNLKESLTEVARAGVSELISSLVKLGIQWLVNAALGRTIAAASLAVATTASVAAAATTAAAWVPAAAAVSLASFGANSIPADLGLASTFALAKSLSLMTGFQKGGYTGDSAPGQIAGVVHGQEFVMNAAATAANRGTLEAMNAGTSVGSSNAPAKVVIEDHTSGGVAFESARGLSDGEIRLIARDEAKAVVRKETGDVMSSELANPNSRASRAIGSNYQVQRSR